MVEWDDHELLVERLDYYYTLVSCQILQHQSLTHGLFPLKIDDKENCEGHVRDNVYCAMCIWTLSLAYRHIDHDEGRQYELEQSAVKCMRGILFFYMRQANKLEAFKKDQQSVNSLHCKFNIKNCDVSKDTDYQPLQMDAVALYLIVLVQMIASGLYIIFTTDEVHFIQNLVYYIERSYRISEFGMWERGTRYNTGQPELNASSIGMVKAALESINGFNLFGFKGTQSSIIYVDSDAHYHNISTLKSLLPRESNSKKSDAALLTIIGFPAFAIDDVALRNETKEIVISELQGSCGLKRFHCDGYGCVLEDTNKQHYERGEVMRYESVECEWPIFYLYLALDAIFQGDVTGGGYMESVKELLTYSKYGKIIPKYYFVTKRNIQYERQHPGEVERFPNEDVEETFLWGQSLYLIANMLVEKLITCQEIDPVGRANYGNTGHGNHLSINHRYSSFQVGLEDLVVQVCLISESRNLQVNLATYGIETQTPKEIEPIVICPPHDLVHVYEELGKNNKLNLSGRPLRPFGVLGTSKIYKILGKTVVTYPIRLEKDFYMSHDMCLLINDLKTGLAFIRSHWNMSGRPTVCLFLRDYNFRGLHSTLMVDFMAQLKSGEVDGVNVKLGKLQCLIGSGCVEHLDYLKEHECTKINVITNAESYTTSPCGFESVHHPVLSIEDHSEDMREEIDKLNTLPTQQIVQLFQGTNSINVKMVLLQIIRKRDGPAYSINDISIEDHINEIYIKALFVQNWSVVRQGAALLDKSVASMAPSITSLLVCGKEVILGVFGQPGYVINKPLATSAITDIIYSMCMDYDPREVSLQQEIVVYLGGFVVTGPQLFKGMFQVNVGSIIEAMKKLLESAWTLTKDSSDLISIYDLYPYEVQHLLKAVLSGCGKLRNCDMTPRHMFEQRTLEGMLNRVPSGFYRNVWGILQHTPGGIKVKDHHLPQQPVLSEMTANEIQFKILVEQMLLEVTSPVERQISIELIMIIATVVLRNPELHIEPVMNLTCIVEDAISLFMKEGSSRTREQFFFLNQREQNGSMMYLTRSFINNVLQDSMIRDEPDETCCIS